MKGWDYWKRQMEQWEDEAKTLEQRAEHLRRLAKWINNRLNTPDFDWDGIEQLVNQMIEDRGS